MKYIKKQTFVLILLSLILTGCGGKTEELVILHVNDTHSYFLSPLEHEGKLGGVARRATVIEGTRKENSNVLVMDAGGIFTGSAFSTVYKGEMNIELMNRMEYDAMTVGHHEFDFGTLQMKKLQKKALFAVLSANIIDRKNGKPLFLQYVIKQVGSVKVAMIGLMSSKRELIQQEVYEHIDLIDEEKALRKTIEENDIKKRSDIIIVLSHTGLEKSVELARKISGIDVIISGYGDRKTASPLMVNNTLIAQAGNNGEYIGKLTLLLEKSSIKGFRYNLIALDKTIRPDTDIERYVIERHSRISKWLVTTVCRSDTLMTIDGIRTSSTVLGNFISDVFRDIGNTDLAIVNAGAIRGEIPPGDVQTKNILELYPYNNRIIALKLKGSELIKIVKKGVKKRGDGGFLHYSKGMSIKVEKGVVTGITLNGKDIKPFEEYSITTMDFLANGGDGYTEFASASSLATRAVSVREKIIEVLKRKKEIRKNKLDFSERITFN